VPFSLEASCTNNLSGRSSIETCQLNTPLQSNLTGATPKGIKSTSRSTAWCSNVIRAPSRNSVITPATQGKKYQVSTGNKWSNILIREEMIGHKFGEFAWTKKIAQYKRKSKIKKKGR
jgi:small subunit ribosomal protein S19